MANFLSCLCGSEQLHLKWGYIPLFLSCLCGSEQAGESGEAGESFLSCLCGSEPKINRRYCIFHNTLLRITDIHHQKYSSLQHTVITKYFLKNKIIGQNETGRS